MERVIFSIGFGRLYLVHSAERLAKQGVKVRLVVGWIPRNAGGALVKLASRFCGRNLEMGFKKRQVVHHERIEVCQQPLVEAVDAVVRRGLRALRLSTTGWATFAWKMWGFFSRRFITKDAQVFHVRSGAGQGGAIAKAKRLGLKVLVDHSIAHPLYMERHLRGEYEKNGTRFDLGISSRFWQLVAKDCEDADIVLVNSFFVRDTFLEAGYAPERLRVVYQGTREDFFGLRGKAPYFDGRRPLRILFTGGFGFRKGAEYILAALEELKKRGVSYTMDVVGSYGGSEVLQAKYHAKDLPIAFHGTVPQDELKSYLSAADVYLFPSLAEGCASSGLEAMAAGICVVATHESGLPIADGETGYLVPGKDSAAIVERIEWLVAHPENIKRVGQSAAKLIAEKYTWPQYAENVKRVYEELSCGGRERVAGPRF